MQKFPSVGCKCVVCEALRRQGIPDETYTEYLAGYEIPIRSDWCPGPSAIDVKRIFNPTTGRIEKTFYPYGVYRFNYSTVDGYGFGATHSIVLEVLQAMTPAETFSNFMDLGDASGIRCHLIEYFMVRWENGEYVRV